MRKLACLLTIATSLSFEICLALPGLSLEIDSAHNDSSPRISYSHTSSWKKSSSELAEWSKWHKELSSALSNEFGRNYPTGIPGQGLISCAVTYRIINDKITNIRLDKSSGINTFDSALMKSIKGLKNGSQLRFPSQAQKKPISERIAITVDSNNYQPKIGQVAPGEDSEKMKKGHSPSSLGNKEPEVAQKTEQENRVPSLPRSKYLFPTNCVPEETVELMRKMGSSSSTRANLLKHGIPQTKVDRFIEEVHNRSKARTPGS